MKAGGPIKRIERIGGQTLILGDCLEVMPLLGKFDACVTSPPYDDLRDYGAVFEGVDCLAVISGIAGLLSDGGVCMWNVADATVGGGETGSSFRQALHAIDCGLRLHDTMIYCKSGFSFPESNRYPSCHEYMFIFSNGSPRCFNGITDRRNKKFGCVINGTRRTKDGNTIPATGNGKAYREFGVRLNWWEIKNCHRDKSFNHPATMPYPMAHDHITSWTNQGDTVLDPFLGSGTTLVACQKLGRRGTGIELDESYFEISCERVQKAADQPDLFVSPPAPKPTQEGFL